MKIFIRRTKHFGILEHICLVYQARRFDLSQKLKLTKIQTGKNLRIWCQKILFFFSKIFFVITNFQFSDALVPSKNQTRTKLPIGWIRSEGKFLCYREKREWNHFQRNPCLPNPCQRNSHCQVTQARTQRTLANKMTFKCICEEGFIEIGNTCDDINECEGCIGVCIVD